MVYINMSVNSSSQWVRPNGVPYPNVWDTFDAKESKSSEKIVKFIIQDLPEDRFEDAVQHMAEIYMADHPISRDAIHDKDYMDDNKEMWRTVLEQKTSLVCFKEHSDEIVGLSLHLVRTKNDTFSQGLVNTSISKRQLDEIHASAIFYTNFDPYEKYKVDSFIGSAGVSVHPLHRECGIGGRLLAARKLLGKAFDVKIAVSRFTSDQLSRVAERIGFQLDVEYTIEELTEINSSVAYLYENARTSKIALKTWVF